MSKFQAEYNIANQPFEDFIMLGFDSEKAWYSFVKKNYRHLFPRMCDRSQFNRTRRNLLQVTNLIFIELAKAFEDDVFIVDSFSLKVCKFGRAHFCKASGATSANVDDRVALCDLSLNISPRTIILADKVTFPKILPSVSKSKDLLFWL